MKAAAAAAAVSEGEADGELSPLPLPGGQLPRRRGGISAEPVTEEDATSYVKKVSRKLNPRNYGFLQVQTSPESTFNLNGLSLFILHIEYEYDPMICGTAVAL